MESDSLFVSITLPCLLPSANFNPNLLSESCNSITPLTLSPPFQADEYAVDLGYAEDLQRGLVKLQVGISRPLYLSLSHTPSLAPARPVSCCVMAPLCPFSSHWFTLIFLHTCIYPCTHILVFRLKIFRIPPLIDGTVFTITPIRL